MTLMLHAGAQPIDYDGLRQLETPAATESHVPIPHHRVVDLVRSTLGMYGHEVVDEHHGVTDDGARYFGVMSLRSPYTGYEDTVVLRNSHDKKFPVGIGFGSRVFICDNLAFIADQVIRRKHTANLKGSLPGLIIGLIEPLAEQRELQAKMFDRYKAAELTQQTADHAILDCYRHGIVGIQGVPQLIREYEEPTFEEFREEPMNAWRLFNAVTYILTGKVAEKPDATSRLHRIIDGVCDTIH